jgi:[DsrC]-trisulfide reductase subunit P
MLDLVVRGEAKYWGWLGLLGVLIAVGGGFFQLQLSEGLAVTGLSRDVSWGFYVAQLTFLVGIAASAVMLVLPYYVHDFKAFGKITVVGESVAVASIFTSLLFLFVDLGQPARAINVYLHATPGSIIFWDATVLPAYMIVNAVVGWTVLRAERAGRPPPTWLKPLVLLSIPLAFSIHTVTAFLYCGLPGRGFWLTAILAPRFIASAFASGTAFLILLCMLLRRVTRFDASKEALEKLSQITLYGMLANLFFLFCEVFVVMYARIPSHISHLTYLYVGLDGKSALVPWMWASVVFMVGGACLLSSSKGRKSEAWLAASCGLVFSGTWIDKGLGLLAGGFAPSPLHHVTEYAPTMPELFISLGVYGMGFLILTLLLKMVVSVRRLPNRTTSCRR